MALAALIKGEFEQKQTWQRQDLPCAMVGCIFNRRWLSFFTARNIDLNESIVNGILRGICPSPGAMPISRSMMQSDHDLSFDEVCSTAVADASLVLVAFSVDATTLQFGCREGILFRPRVCDQPVVQG